MKIEAKGAPVEIDVKAVNEDGLFHGYASVFNVRDRGGDIVMPGAFQKSLQAIPAGRVKMLWQHDRSEVIGVWEKFEEDERGLKATGRLILETSKGREAHALMKAGAVDGLSIGYRTVRDAVDRQKGARLLHEVELREVSIVTFPMADGATVSSVKNATGSHYRDLVDAINGARRRIS